MYIEDILSMPDKWEYPFFAIWDTVSLTLARSRVAPTDVTLSIDDTGIPLHTFGDDRPSLRQEATRHYDERVVHETRWSTPSLRMEFQRRQSSCPCLVSLSFPSYSSLTVLD